MVKYIFITIVTLLLYGCITKKKEYVMPYYNLAYTSSRLQPISLNDDSVVVRIWINNGTSVDRVISVSKGKLGASSTLDEISLNKKSGFNQRSQIIPKSGIDAFLAKVDSLKLFETESQKEEAFGPAFDTPFSFYVVELKRKNQYHCFKFYTTFPFTANTDTKYDQIEKLIRNEFIYSFYMNK